MAEKINQELDNTFVLPFVSKNLKWYERDGLDTWFKQRKCEEFLNNTDNHFQQRKIVNFDLIYNGDKLDENQIRQYQTVNCETIKMYPQEQQQKIMSSIIRNIKRDDMFVCKKAAKEHFTKEHFTNKQKSIGRGKFLKICRDSMYASSW